MGSNRNFIIFALPRSRTTWLSRFLSYGEWHCGHDEVIRMRQWDDVKSWLTLDKTGSVEPSIAPFWRTVVKFAPEARIATIRRPVAEVVESAIRAGAPACRDDLTKAMAKHDAKLDQIERRVPGVLRVEYDDLATASSCARLFEHCLGLPHDPAWWRSLANQNIQINFPWLVQYMAANRTSVEKLAALAKHYTLRDMALHPVPERSEVVIAEEDGEVFFRDSREMFERHCAMAGEHPKQFMLKNIELIRKLRDLDRLQVITARSNGRVFGYLMTVIGPSLEEPGRQSATHTFFYAGLEFPGIGLKMQREALVRLRHRGVNEVFFHDGVRGTGGRNHVIFKRLGAEEFGSVYRLNMEGS